MAKEVLCKLCGKGRSPNEHWPKICMDCSSDLAKESYDNLSELATSGQLPVRFPHWKWSQEYISLFPHWQDKAKHKPINIKIEVFDEC